MQWCDCVSEAYREENGDLSADGVPSATFHRVCAQMVYAQGAASRLGERQAEFSTALHSKPMVVVTEAYASHHQRMHGTDTSGGGNDGDVAAHLHGTVSRIAHAVRAAARRTAANEKGGNALARAGSADKPGKMKGESVDELLRRLSNGPSDSGFAELLEVAKLNSIEHARALEAAGKWAGRKGIELADDLLGGGIDLSADAALWEDFLTNLRLSNPVLTNRIRRELLRRRATMAEQKPSAAKGGHQAAAKSPGGKCRVS